MARKISFKIGKFVIKENSRVFIIAEAGVNHNGELSKALELIDIAVDAGADAVKFQTFKAEQVVNSKAEMASYQKKNLGTKETQQEMLKRLELPESFYKPLIKRCIQKGIMFLSTPHGGVESARLLHKLKIDAYKIPSQDLTNFILLNEVAKYKKPILLSTGMSTLKEIKDAVKFIVSRGNKKIVLLQCTTNYPCPDVGVNLRAMQTMMKTFSFPVGYSDHTTSMTACVASTAMGSCLYECHYTLDKTLPGPDHVASCNPEELRDRIVAIRQTEIMLGSSVKKPTESELKLMLPLVRKSIVAKRDLKKDDLLKITDMEAKRPFKNGVSPSKFKMFLGRRLLRSVSEDEQLHFSDVK